MKKLIIPAIIAIMFSSNAIADWIPIGENNRSTAYVDTAIRRTGDNVIFWALYNYKSVQESPVSGKKYLSEKSQGEMDCKSERTRILFFTWHSDQMGNGVVVHTGNKIRDWETTGAPGSFANAFWKIICGKR